MKKSIFEGVKMEKILLKRVVSIFTVIMLLLGLISISGCSSRTIKEKEVFEDIKAQDQYCSKFDFTYDSMEVIKRMTDEEKKTDNVWVNFTCHNKDFKYTVECVVNYILYNEGWIFEKYEILDSSYAALTTPDETTVLKDFEDIKFEKIEVNNDFGGEYVPNMYNFLGHSKSEVSEYFTWDNYHYIHYEFTPETGWFGKIGYEEQREVWNWEAFIGKWLVGGESIDKIGINAIDSQSITVDWYDEDWEGNIETFTKDFNMNYVTGVNEIIDYPDDIPVYSVWLEFDEAEYGESLNLTPYGIYGFVAEDKNGIYNGINIDGNNFSNKFEKIS